MNITYYFTFISATGKMRPVGRTRILHLCKAIRDLISTTRNKNIRTSRNNYFIRNQNKC